MRIWPAAAAPAEWLLCQGQTVAQAIYVDLSALLGGAFNTGGEPAGSFRLPDLRNRVHATVGTALAIAASDALAEALRTPTTHAMSGGNTGNNTWFSDGHLLGPTGGSVEAPVVGTLLGGVVNSVAARHSHDPATLDAHLLANSNHYHLQTGSVAEANFMPFLGLHYMIYAGV